MKFVPLSGTVDDKVLTEEFSDAVKVEKWRIGKSVRFQAAPMLPVKYLPFSEITKAYPHDFQIKSGCSCAGTYPSRGVVIGYGEKGILKLIPNKEKSSDQIISLLKERIPGLDIEIPDLYKNETREKY